MADPGVTSRNKNQGGLESSSGTAVPATFIRRGPAVFIKDESVKEQPDENVGYRTGTTRVYTPKIDASLTFPNTQMTFEQGPYPFSGSVTNVVSGAANGGTSNALVYAYVLPVAADPSFRTYTWEAGDNQQAEEMEYSFCEEIKITGTPGSALMIAEKWRGRQRTTTTFTGSLAPTAVEEILFSKGKLYIDASTIGSTQATNTWLGMEITINPGLYARHTGDGQLYFSHVIGVAPSIKGRLTFAHDATGVAQKALFAAGSARKVRMQWDGSATGFTGTGGTFANRIFRIDESVKIISYDDGSQNGSNIVNIGYEMGYDGTLGFEATFCNILAALL